HSRTVRSALPVASSVPSGEKAAEITLSVCPVSAPRSVAVATSHSFTSPLVLPPFLAGMNSLPPADTSSLPSGEKATEQTQSLCLAGAGRSLPVARSRILTRPCQVPSARVLPLGE